MFVLTILEKITQTRLNTLLRKCSGLEKDRKLGRGMT